MRLTPPDPPTERIPIQDECFIAARYGHRTWGHWLGEILPLVALAERVYPGRFRYATTFYGGDGASYGSRVAESFAAYGISENRLFRMMANRSYTLAMFPWTSKISRSTRKCRCSEPPKASFQFSARASRA
jgi:hypothetical protein